MFWSLLFLVVWHWPSAAQDALTSAVHSKDPRYYVDGRVARIVTEQMIEIRLIPGWQLDPKCPESRWGEDECNGGLGYLLFNGFIRGRNP